jgi:hypothetical protein
VIHMHEHERAPGSPPHGSKGWSRSPHVRRARAHLFLPTHCLTSWRFQRPFSPATPFQRPTCRSSSSVRRPW